jgi:chorismate mutase/prephenate dehydrogenase
MKLDDLRHQIDSVDTRIMQLLAERQQLSAAIGKEKARCGQAVTDNVREAAVMSRIRQMAQELGLDGTAIESIYLHIIAASKSVQGQKEQP